MCIRDSFRTSHTRRADVDAGDLSRGPTQGMFCRLGCSATGNKNGIVFPIRPARPKEMIIGAAFLLVFPDPAILFKALDRRRIRISVVEVLDLLCYIKIWRRVVCSLAHGAGYFFSGSGPGDPVIGRSTLIAAWSDRGWSNASFTSFMVRAKRGAKR